MNFDISNKIHKLLLTLGFSLIAYSVYQIDNLKLKQLDFLNNSNLVTINSQLQVYSDWYVKMFYLGCSLSFFGIIIWIREYEPQSLNEKRFRNCQSCGKKFSGKRYYGTNKDETNNFFYCMECFDKGEFTNPNLTIEDLLTEENIKAYNKNIFKLDLRKHIESLDRWDKKHY